MNICVFGSSSPRTKQRYIDESYVLGQLLAERGLTCVNGGGRYGCMGGMNDGCHRCNGTIVGIIHKKFCVDITEHPFIKDLVVVDGDDLYERKLALFNNSECVIVLPGGVGTFDELFDGVSSKSLNMKNMTYKPICLVNIDGFYDGFIQQMERAYEDNILYHPVQDYFHVEDNAKDALDWCINQLNDMRAKGAVVATNEFIDDRVKSRSPESNSVDLITYGDQNHKKHDSDMTQIDDSTNSKYIADKFSTAVPSNKLIYLSRTHIMSNLVGVVIGVILGVVIGKARDNTRG